MKRWFPIGGVIIILFVWFLVCQFNLVNTLLIPHPTKVGQKIVEFFFKKTSLIDLGATLYRVLFSFMGTIFIGIPLGILFGYSKKLLYFFEIPIDFFRSLPAPVLFPLFMLLFGIGDKAKLSLVIFSGSLITLVYTTYGVKNCPRIKIMTASTLKLSKLSLFSRVILPQALPEIVSGLRISLSVVLILVIVLEMFTGSRLGLGKRVYDDHLMFRISEMYAVIIITGFLGYLLNKLFMLFESRLVHWAGK